MKVYKIRIKKWANDYVELTTIAPNIDKALDNAKRYAKKNYYSSSEIRVIEHVMDVDIFYKS